MVVLVEAVVYFGCVSSRINRIKFKFSWIKVCMAVGTIPIKEMVRKGIGSGTTWVGLWIA